jgi:uncharacterized protein (TIRG00374 family)
LKIIISLAIIVILANTIEIDKILQALRNARLEWVLWTIIMFPINLGLQFTKWRLLLGSLKRVPGFWEVLSSMLVGFTLGLATPGRMGEIGRAFAIRDKEPLRVIGLSLADKFYNLGCIALFGGIGILTLPGMILEQNFYIIISSLLIYLVGAGIIVFLATHPGFVRGILYSISLMLPKRDKLKGLISCLDGVSSGLALKVFGISILFYIIFTIQFYLLTLAFSNLTLIDGIRGLPAIIFTKTFLPVSIGGLGIGELAAVRFLKIFGIEAAAAFNASMILFTLNVMVPGIVGFFFIPGLKFNFNSSVKGKEKQE